MVPRSHVRYQLHRVFVSTRNVMIVPEPTAARACPAAAVRRLSSAAAGCGGYEPGAAAQEAAGPAGRPGLAVLGVAGADEGAASADGDHEPFLAEDADGHADGAA